MRYTSKLILNGTEYAFSAGGGGGWQPGANTIAYYPLEDDFNDYSGNGYDLTNDYVVLGTSSDGYKGAYLELGHCAYTTAFDFTSNSSRTIAFCTGCQTLVEGSWTVAIFLGYNPALNQADGLGYTTYNYETWGLGNLWCQGIGAWSAEQPINLGSIVDANNMHSYVATIDTNNSQFKFYKDGVLVATTGITYQTIECTGFSIGNIQDGNLDRNANGYLRQVVIDSDVWSADDVLAYHNGIM